MALVLYNQRIMTPIRIAILADIHGTLPALQAVVEDLQPRSPDEIVIAGDFLGGPQPKETLALLTLDLPPVGSSRPGLS